MIGSPFSHQRKAELHRLQDSLICNQLNKNHFSHAWKQTYEQVNDFCDAFCIPYKSRNKFYIKELEFLSLYIHDILPKGFNEQGIYEDDPSISRYTLFFRVTKIPAPLCRTCFVIYKVYKMRHRNHLLVHKFVSKHVRNDSC